MFKRLLLLVLILILLLLIYNIYKNYKENFGNKYNDQNYISDIEYFTNKSENVINNSGGKIDWSWENIDDEPGSNGSTALYPTCDIYGKTDEIEDSECPWNNYEIPVASLEIEYDTPGEDFDDFNSEISDIRKGVKHYNAWRKSNNVPSTNVAMPLWVWCAMDNTSSRGATVWARKNPFLDLAGTDFVLKNLLSKKVDKVAKTSIFGDPMKCAEAVMSAFPNQETVKIMYPTNSYEKCCKNNKIKCLKVTKNPIVNNPNSGVNNSSTNTQRKGVSLASPRKQPATSIQ